MDKFKDVSLCSVSFIACLASFHRVVLRCLGCLEAGLLYSWRARPCGVMPFQERHSTCHRLATKPLVVCVSGCSVCPAIELLLSNDHVLMVVASAPSWATLQPSSSYIRHVPEFSHICPHVTFLSSCSSFIENQRSPYRDRCRSQQG